MGANVVAEAAVGGQWGDRILIDEVKWWAG